VALLGLRGEEAWQRRHERRALQDEYRGQHAAREQEATALLDGCRGPLEQAGWVTVDLSVRFGLRVVPPEYAEGARAWCGGKRGRVGG